MKNKKILFIILPIILVLVVATIFLTLYLTTDMFKSSNVLFAKYFIQNQEILNIIENENIEDQKQFKQNNTYTMTGDLVTTVQEGDKTQEIVFSTAGIHDASTERTYSEITLKNGETDALKVSYINSGDVYALKCDDIMANYIGFRNSELKKFAQSMGLSQADAKNIPDSIDFNRINNILKLTDEEKQHIINTYSKVLNESVPAEKYKKVGKTAITIEGTNYETNAYQVELDMTTLKQILINFLTTLQNDNNTLVILSNKLSTLGLSSEYTDVTKISEIIGNAISQISEQTISDAIHMKVTVYENKGITLRTEVEIQANQEENIESFSNTTGETDIIMTTNKSTTSKITVDKVQTGNKLKSIITMEENKASSSQNNITGETNEGTPQTSLSQIILQKTITDTETTIETTVVPDMNNMAQTITMNTTMGKIINGTASNMGEITLNMSSDGINVQTVKSSYTQMIQTATEIEEIMELKNSNTVIVNNYPKEQLIPFLTQAGQKIGQVVPAKLGQLGIDINKNQNTNNGMGTSNIMNISNNVIKFIQLVGVSGVNIANVNGVDTQGIAVGVIGGLQIYIFNMANEAIIDATLNMREEQVKEQQLVENMETTIDALTAGKNTIE